MPSPLNLPPPDLGGALQENLLTLMTYSPTAAPVIRAVLEPSLFDSATYQLIATRVMAYYDQFHKPPGEHLPDLLDDVLRDGTPKAAMVADILRAMHESAPHINSEYVLSQLVDYVRTQVLKDAVVTAVDALQRNDRSQAEVALHAALNYRLETFQPGTDFRDPSQAFQFLNGDLDVEVPLGIKELDAGHIGLNRKELFLMIGLASRGKTWFLVHVGKQAILHRKRVLHVSLEMSEPRVARRYTQALFAISKWQAKSLVHRFATNPEGYLMQVQDEMVDLPTFRDPGIRARLTKQHGKLAGRLPLMIKEFPTGSLSMTDFRAYLDALERRAKFTPDVILLDYPSLMKTDLDRYRLDLGQITRDLRGLAGERNIMLVAVQQGNRAGERSRWLGREHQAEDFSAGMTADVQLAYNQTSEEYSLGLARLSVLKARDEAANLSVIISQGYEFGQFVIDSCKMRNDYFTPPSKEKARSNETNTAPTEPRPVPAGGLQVPKRSVG